MPASTRRSPFSDSASSQRLISHDVTLARSSIALRRQRHANFIIVQAGVRAPECLSLRSGDTTTCTFCIWLDTQLSATAKSSTPAAVLNNVINPALPRATARVSGGLGHGDVSPRDDLREGLADIGGAGLTTHVACLRAALAQQCFDRIDDGATGFGLAEMLQH
jgi:hypothetical protein